MQQSGNISKAAQQPRIVAPDGGKSFRPKLILDDGVGVQVALPHTGCALTP